MSENQEAGPLNRLTEEEIAHLLRGFSDSTISSAQGLRVGSDETSLEACLFGILAFYLPPGTKPPETQPSGETRLRDDLGLDSLSLAEAMFKIEELFDVLVDNSEIAEVHTLADARRLLVEKLEKPDG
ncbi:MAG: acyl carrier protein [Verrucomicrobiales bacterium]|jgi:acyl carrier protein